MRNILGIVAVLALASAAATAGQDYIGSAKCKICHKTEYASWLEMPHAKAFERLEGDEQSDAECLRCHTTGGDAARPGVGCESCHGPGSEYKSLKVMKDPEAAVAAGLIQPNEATCKTCHEKAPHEVPTFDFETAKEKGLHAVKEKG